MWRQDAPAPIVLAHRYWLVGGGVVQRIETMRRGVDVSSFKAEHGLTARALVRCGLLAGVMLACSQLPCSAQHMNAPGAPCQQAGSNAETGQCFDLASQNADGELNRTYAQIRKVLLPEDRANLEGAERAWLKYRNATCAAERKLYGQGTGAFPAYAACLEAETRQRTSDLLATYGWKVEKAR